MHGFIKQLPEYRQAKRSFAGEQEERERVLSLIRQRLVREHDREPDAEVQHDSGIGVAVLEELERAVRYGWHR